MLGLSQAEQRLVSFLQKGPRDRVELIEFLYGPNLSYETKLSRLKSALFTLRKKHPTLIRYENDRYRLSAVLHLSPLKKGKS
jgi:hypothetical protein